MARSSAPVMYWAVCTTIYIALWLKVVLAISSGDAAGQDALDGAAVEPLEDPRDVDKSFQPPEVEESLSCPLHDCAGVCGPH
jgi:hypothetical protein